MSLKQHYCIVTQEEANEARELLVKAGEPIWDDEYAFVVLEDRVILQTSECGSYWMVDFLYKKTKRKKKILTYPQFKEMLNAKIKEDGK